MKNKGGIVVVAAGNSGGAESILPSSSMIAVSATDSGDTKASFSSYGSYVDVAAPGVDIYTTKRGGSYQKAWGTSLASPITAGVVALMMAAKSSLAPGQIESLLFSTADDLGSPGVDAYYGNGRINARAAVQAAALASPADTQAPVATITSPTGGTVKGLVSVNVNATDNVGVVKVNLLVNGSQIGSDTTQPFGFSWDSTRNADGEANLLAFAYDAAGNYTGSMPVTITVANNTTTTNTSTGGSGKGRKKR
jgi:thermitase